MKKKLGLLVSISFLIVSSILIAWLPQFHFFLPAQQVELSHGVQYGAVLKDFLFVQEITIKKRFLSGIDIYMAKLPSPVVNSNVFLLISEDQRILFTQKFRSDEFGEALHFPFHFNHVFDIGKGKKVYACIYSTDGDQQSYIGLARKNGSAFGKLYVMPILQNDVLQSFSGKQSVVDFPGSLGIRTYESETRAFSLFQCLMYGVVLVISLIILFYKKVEIFILKWSFKPEWVTLVTGITFGSVMLVITPPFQVPDEPVHFFRSWQIADFNLFKTKDEVPRALAEFGDTCKRMKFSTHEKTSFPEIKSLAGIQVNENDVVKCETPDYIIPYLPQAAGLLSGKILGLKLLWSFYLGRLFNLIATLILIFLAIRILPVFRWLFMILGILPMALYQFASFSYDAGTIGLSYLLIALILRTAFGNGERNIHKDYLIILLVAVILSASKPPYFLIIFLFLVIPVLTFRTLKRYLLHFMVIILAIAFFSQFQGLTKKMTRHQAYENHLGIEYASLLFPVPGSFRNLDQVLPSKSSVISFMSRISGRFDMGNKTETGEIQGSSAQNQDNAPVQSVTEENPINPSGQIKFILTHPFEYMGIVINTLKKSGNLYMVSLIGLFGWIDTQIPDFLAYLNILVLILLASFSTVKTINISLRQRIVFFLTFSGCFLLIETALYMYCNPVGSHNIIAIQGRYFIAIIPLLLIAFYRNSDLKSIFTFGKKDAKTVKSGKSGKQPLQKHGSEDKAIIRLLPLASYIIVLVTLFWSVYLILDRFFILYL